MNDKNPNISTTSAPGYPYVGHSGGKLKLPDTSAPRDLLYVARCLWCDHRTHGVYTYRGPFGLSEGLPEICERCGLPVWTIYGEDIQDAIRTAIEKMSK